ncbi:DNA primase [Patescibacteria group bacterium]|nr:DNA primase [Patescibacteria group bacterium]
MNTSVIEQIKSRLPIQEVLASYITLIPTGGQFKAKCPFHNERTASFSVSPERGLYYCFGCSAKGDIVNFVQEFEGVDFKGALKILADKAGIVLSAYEPTDKIEKDETDRVFDALDTTATKYEKELQHNPSALEYLTRRGVTSETIKEFRLGYAPDEWRYLSGTASIGDSHYLERAGLSKKTDKGYYDRFRGRIMFPLSDSSGRIVGFSGRMFPDTPEGPKYLNSPETEVFQKSRILFGFDKAKQAIRKHNFAVMVEGQMDLVLSHQAGFKNTVATSGTAVSEQSATDMNAQLVVLSRLTPNLFMAFDGDSAGEKALARAALVALTLGMNPKVVSLPDKVDPADFILQEGTDAWKEKLKVSEHYILHTLHTIQSQAASAHGLKLSIREKLFPFLQRVKSQIERQTYLNTIAQESNLSSSSIQEDFSAFEKEHSSVSLEQSKSSTQVSTKPLTHLERFAAFVTLYPSDAAKAVEQIKAFVFNDNTIVLPELTDSHEAVLAFVERQYQTFSSSDRVSVAEELAQTIIDQFLQELKFQYSMKMTQAKTEGDDTKEMEYLSLLQKINQYKHSKIDI